MSTKNQIISAKFPEKLKSARQQKGFTQGQLAQRVGSDSQRISKYERGVMVPTTAILIKGLLDAFIKKSKFEMLPHN